ncbi:MAG: hypothetical protein IKO83_04925 [Oscillospiraceae bacterium]|nr:hypothetical protein [Oscillospiraceae bacterium]
MELDQNDPIPKPKSTAEALERANPPKWGRCLELGAPSTLQVPKAKKTGFVKNAEKQKNTGNTVLDIDKTVYLM